MHDPILASCPHPEVDPAKDLAPTPSWLDDGSGRG